MNAELAKVTAQRIREAGKVQASQATVSGTSDGQAASIQNPQVANQTFETTPVSGRRHDGIR